MDTLQLIGLGVVIFLIALRQVWRPKERAKAQWPEFQLPEPPPGGWPEGEEPY